MILSIDCNEHEAVELRNRSWWREKTVFRKLIGAFDHENVHPNEELGNEVFR